MKQSSGFLYKKINFWAGILIIGLLVGLSLQLVRAWTEPTVAPPGGNVGAPLNTSNIGQFKEGGLILNTSGAPNGLIVDKGNVGIGTLSPNSTKGTGGYLDVKDVWIRDYNGGSGTWASNLSGGIGENLVPNSQIFSANGVFTVPQGVNRIRVQVWGGGGGGFIDNSRGGGGGGGGFIEGIFMVSPGQEFPVTVGKGGKGSRFYCYDTGGMQGCSGGNSSFGTLLTAYGGGGAGTTPCPPYYGDGSAPDCPLWGQGGASSGANFTIRMDGSNGVGGYGGGPGGRGGMGGYGGWRNAGTPVPAQIPGGGGDSTDMSGADGRVIVYW